MTIARAPAFLLLTLCALPVPVPAHDQKEPIRKAGFVRHDREGETLRDTERQTEVVKVAPEDSTLLGLVTSRYKKKGIGISVHAHDYDDEVFFVHKGGGIFILGEERISIKEDDTVFIPKGQWHGFENERTDTLLVWAISSSKYLELHRMTFVGPDAVVVRLYSTLTGDETVSGQGRSEPLCGDRRSRQ